MLAQPRIWFLRDSARRLREIARVETPIADDLIAMAEDLEARADELQDTHGFTKAPPSVSY